MVDHVSPTSGDFGDGGPAFEQRIFAEAGSSVYAVLHGDMHVRNEHPVYRFEAYPIETPSIDVTWARLQPSRLLAAECRVVPFSGREEELDQLKSWRDAPPQGISVLLVHGPGGQGKTRLAAQFAIDSAERGWTVWAGHHVSDPTAELVVAPGEPGSALVVIVEYAERWPVDDLQLLLQNPLLHRPARARVLLLSRPARAWWPALRHRLNNANMSVGGTISLQGLGATNKHRQELFNEARDRFAEIFEVPAHAVSPPDSLNDDGYELVLNVHMLALVRVDGYVRGATPPANPVGLSAYLLDREHDYWQSLYDHDGTITTEPRIMARIVYTATLVRPMPRLQAVRVIRQVRVADKYGAMAAIQDHARCYPSNKSSLSLEPLLPDRLGEDLIALLTPGHNNSDYQPDDWAANAPTQLLVLNAVTERPPWTKPAISVLIEAAHRWPHLANLQLYPLLRRNPNLVLAAGGGALARLAEIRDVPIDVLEVIESKFPESRQFDLDIGIAEVLRVLTADRLRRTTDPIESGDLHALLAIRFSYAGRPEEAVTANRNAIQFYRASGRNEPQILRRFAESFGNLSLAFSETGRHKSALVAATESVSVLRDVPTSADQNASLAHHLTNLSAAYLAVGQHEAAFTAAREAVEIYRGFAVASADPEESLPGLALALDNASLALAYTGRVRSALDYSDQALAAHRKVARLSQAHRPYLARALSVAAIRRIELKRPQDALSLAVEAVSLARELSELNPASFLQRLADALSDLAICLITLNLIPQALDAAQESVQIRQQLVQENPAAVEPKLAASLDHLGITLLRIGRAEEAVEAIESAVRILERLARDAPERYGRDYAVALDNLARSRARLGRHGDALIAAKMSVSIWRDTIPRAPRRHLPDYAGAVRNLGEIQDHAGHVDQLLETLNEEFDVRVRLAFDDPSMYGSALLLRGYEIARLCSRIGEPDRSVQLLEQLVDFSRRAGADWRVPEHDLAIVLATLGTVYAQTERPTDAIILLEQAATLYRSLAETDSGLLSDLARLVSDIGVVRWILGRRTEALAADREAVDLYRAVISHDPRHVNDLSRALRNLAIALLNSQEFGDAELSAEEAVRTLKRVLGPREADFDEAIARSLATLAQVRWRIGSSRESVLAAAQEATRALRPFVSNGKALMSEYLAVRSIINQVT